MSRPVLQHGFSLVEVLITVAVVAVGLLSVAGLQAFSKKSNYDSLQRTTAAALAQDIIERMRANPGQAVAYVTDPTRGISELAPEPDPGVPCNLNAAQPSANTPACIPTQIALYDRYQWSLALFGEAEKGGDAQRAGGLVAATGCITQTSCGVYQVVIAWRGVTPLGSATADTCGTGNPNYDVEGQSTGNGLLRRLVTVQTFVDDQVTPCPAAATR